mmetsp:Transcript_8763/g.8079  ORF Transcript_8763/g.8079 Transcript_8763/m.8079 type:complete len:163 (+) Transcript_8763:1400-1888(+)
MMAGEENHEVEETKKLSEDFALDEVIKKRHDESANDPESREEISDIVMTQFNFNEDLIETLLKVIFENYNIECKLLPALGSLMQMSIYLKKKHQLRSQVINAIVLTLKVFASLPDNRLVDIFPNILINQNMIILLLIGSFRLLSKEDPLLPRFILANYMNQH